LIEVGSDRDLPADARLPQGSRPLQNSLPSRIGRTVQGQNRTTDSFYFSAALELPNCSSAARTIQPLMSRDGLILDGLGLRNPVKQRRGPTPRRIVQRCPILMYRGTRPIKRLRPELCRQGRDPAQSKVTFATGGRLPVFQDGLGGYSRVRQPILPPGPVAEPASMSS